MKQEDVFYKNKREGLAQMRRPQRISRSVWSARYARALAGDGSVYCERRSESGGMRRTPNASRGSVASLYTTHRC